MVSKFIALIMCRYTYYTDLPEDFYPKEIRMLRQKASNGISQVEARKKQLSSVKDANNSPTEDSPKTKHNRLYNQQKQPKLQKEDNNEETPVIMVKLARTNKNKGATKSPKSDEALNVSFEEEVGSRLPLKVENSHQQLLLERQSSRSFFHLKRTNSRLMSMRRPTVKRKMTEMKYTPHATINMRLSARGTDSFELYGGGLPPEQPSHLSIVNVLTC